MGVRCAPAAFVARTARSTRVPRRGDRSPRADQACRGRLIGADRPEVARLTYRGARRHGRARVGRAARRLGVGRGDVVAVQLPNWWEFVVRRLGRRPARRGRQPADADLSRARARATCSASPKLKVLVVPKLSSAGFDHEAMAAEHARRAAQARARDRRRRRGRRTASERCLLQGSDRVDAPAAAGRVGAPGRTTSRC